MTKHQRSRCVLRLATLLLLSALVLAVCAAHGASGTLNHTTDSAPPSNTSAADAPSHRCIFDEIRRQQALENFTSLVQIRPKNETTTLVTDAPVYELFRRSDAETQVNRAEAASADVATVTVSAQSATVTVPRAGYAPIRITAFFSDLDEPSHYCTEVGESVTDFKGGSLACTQAQILTADKKDLLKNTLVPQALLLHAERLMVETLSGNVVVPDLSYSSICTQFTVPDSHHSTGVADTDMIIYVGGGPITSGTVAWATSCSYVGSGRPVVGVTNFSPEYMTNTSDMVRVLAHELLHAMGFSEGSFSTNGMVTTVASLRGKSNVEVIASPTVLSYARAQFGCDTMPGMELEDEGGSGTKGSHWKRRNAINEIMAGVSSIGYYSALTIAAMQDLGYYQGILENAEPLSWGYDAGCDLIDKKCVENATTAYPGMFCTAADATGCTPDRRGLGYCRLVTLNADLDEEYRYFSNPRTSGLMSMMDYCPVYVAYSSSMCTETTGADDYAPGSFFSSSARCLDAQYVKVRDFMGTQNGICANIQCDPGMGTYKVWFKGGREWVPCPEGEWIDPSIHSTTFTVGAVQCAQYGAVCGLTDQVTDSVGFNGGNGNAASGPLRVLTHCVLIAWLLAALAL